MVTALSCLPQCGHGSTLVLISGFNFKMHFFRFLRDLVFFPLNVSGNRDHVLLAFYYPFRFTENVLTSLLLVFFLH